MFRIYFGSAVDGLHTTAAESLSESVSQTFHCIMFCLSQLDDVIDRCLTAQIWHGSLCACTTAKYGNLTCYSDTLIMPFRYL